MQAQIERLREKLEYVNEEEGSDRDECDSPLMRHKKREFEKQIERVDTMMSSQIVPLKKEADAIRDLVITELTRYDDTISSQKVAMKEM